MKLILVAGLVSLFILGSASAVESQRPPALLTFALTFGPNATNGGICLARADGSHRLRVTRRANYREPDWSPRGKLMVLRNWIPGRINPTLSVLNPRGQVIYDIPVPSNFMGYDVSQSEPAWSPDGTRIAYTLSFPSRPMTAELVIVTRTGRLVRRLEVADQEEAGSVAWSPDSTRIAYEKSVHGSSSSVYTSRADGSDRRLFISSASDPDWSPDGSRLAYVNSAGDIAIAGIDGGNARVLTTSSERERNPAWSPDGRLIAFERMDDQAGRSSIVVARSDTGVEVGVIRGGFDAHDPAWRPPTLLPKAKRAPCR